MKRLLIYGSFWFLYFNAASQKTVNVDDVPSITGGAINYMYAVAGTPFVNGKFARIVEGTPFFNGQMMKGAVILKEGKEYKNIRI